MGKFVSGRTIKLRPISVPVGSQAKRKPSWSFLISLQAASALTSTVCAGVSSRPFKISKVVAGIGKVGMFVVWIVSIGCSWFSFWRFGVCLILPLLVFSMDGDIAMT